jgi:maleylpyruvate isomerase
VRRAQVRSLALDIACEIHPLNNLRVLRHLVGPLGLSEQQKTEWMQHWMREGLAVVEARVEHEGFSGAFCVGDAPGLADCLLVPQLFNARRFGVDLTPFPHLTAIEARCLALPAFAATAPDQVPDAE